MRKGNISIFVPHIGCCLLERLVNLIAHLEMVVPVLFLRSAHHQRPNGAAYAGRCARRLRESL